MLGEVGLTRAARLSRLQHLLYRNARGLTTSELARLCGVSQRTAERDLQALEEMGIPTWQEGNRYGITAGYFLPPVHLSLQEAGVLFLASRLLCRYSDEQNPHVVNALAKLAGVLPESIAGHVQRTMVEVCNRPENAELAGVFDTLVLAWAVRRKVRMWYQSARSHNVRDFVFEPFAIEPIDKSTYAIGHADYVDAVRTFKIERIKRAELLAEEFEIPADFDLPGLLETSWGIIWGEGEDLVQVRFSPRVARRLKESVWHSSQTIEDQPDGSCLFTVRIGSVLEITPWLRGWGPDCEVLAPAALRRDMANWARETAGMYKEEG